MAQKVKQTKVKSVATSSVSKRETSNALKIVAGLLLLFFVGILGGVVFYYVTYGDLPMLTDSSAGKSRCLSAAPPNKENCKCVKLKKVYDWQCKQNLVRTKITPNNKLTQPASNYPKVCSYSYCVCNNAKVILKSDGSLIFSENGSVDTVRCSAFSKFSKNNNYTVTGSCKQAKDIKYTVKDSKAESALKQNLVNKKIDVRSLKCVTSLKNR